LLNSSSEEQDSVVGRCTAKQQQSLRVARVEHLLVLRDGRMIVNRYVSVSLHLISLAAKVAIVRRKAWHLGLAGGLTREGTVLRTFLLGIPTTGRESTARLLVPFGKVQCSQIPRHLWEGADQGRRRLLLLLSTAAVALHTVGLL